MREYRLPIELIAELISYLAALGFDPAPYATVSREWQVLIEQRTFATINLNTGQRLAQFKQITAQNTRRRSYIRTINLTIELDPYSTKARAEFETSKEHHRNNKVFVTTIQSLFSILEPWPETESGICLSIQAQSPSDIITPQRSKEARRDPITDLRHRRFERSYLQFSEVYLEGLPAVRAITTLSLGHVGVKRLVLPASCALIASKLPRLQRVDLSLSDSEKRDKALRKQNRNDFARHFHLWPSSIKMFDLTFFGECPRNHDCAPANLTDGKNEDLLSSSLRDFSQQLTFMRLEYIVVGEELFWPISPTDDTQLPFWPNLTTVYLQHGITTPSGEWYFERDAAVDTTFIHGIDREDDLPEHLQRAPEDRVQTPFRMKASPKLINRLYLSAGRAAQRMPQLKFMSIATSEAKAYHLFQYIVDGKTAKAKWDARTLFTPDKPVLQAWRDTAFQHTGMELEVQLEHWQNPVPV